MAAGTITLTERAVGQTKKIIVVWTSGSAGESVVATTDKTYDGKVIALVTDPGATAPTDNYDITALDAEDDDVLIGAGMDRDTANTEVVAEALLGAVANSKLTITVANAGNSKQGRAILWIR